YDSLLPVANDPDYFGDQVIIDENEGIINLVERALINSSIWDLDTTLEMVRNHNGYCIPAHIDAERNSIISQLGFIPDPGVFPALGITARLEIDEFLISHKELRGCSFLRCSDAHYLGDLGVGFTDLFVHEPSIRELDLAARKIDKRIIKI
ncbi:MAG: phosphoesterase, partial [Candidatus Cloacimonetes bacterium]|nr:phosphoesterase [Candidatus Cloacimonadota bacterium]